MSSTPIQIKRGTAANWTAQNPKLLDGQMGYERDTRRIKVGDGLTRWNALPYAIGGGNGSGATIFSDLGDAANAPIATINASVAAVAAAAAAAGTLAASKATLQSGPIVSAAGVAPNASAVLTYVDAAVAGVSAGAPISTAFPSSGIINLDLTQGRDFGLNTVTADVAITMANTSIINGVALGTFIYDGVHNMTFGAFANPDSFAFGGIAGTIHEIAFVNRPSGPIVLGRRVGVLDVGGPAILGIAINNALPNFADFTFSEACDPAHVPAASDFTISGHTTTGVPTFQAGNTVVRVQLTTNVHFFESLLGTYTQGVSTNRLRDPTGNLANSFTGGVVTNNVLSFLPNDPSALTAGTVTTTTIPVTWTVGSADNTHDLATDFVMEKRLAGVGSYVVFADPTSATPSGTFTGLSAGVAYDLRVKGTNAAGSSGYTTLLNVSTAAAPPSAFLTATLTNAPVGENVTAAGYEDYYLERAKGDWTVVRKYNGSGGPSGIITPSLVGSAFKSNVTPFSGLPDQTYTDGWDGASGPVSGGYVADSGHTADFADTGSFTTPRAFRYVVPADTAPHRVKVVVGYYTNSAIASDANFYRISATLSDGSAAALDIGVPAPTPFDFTWTEFDFHYQANANGQTLTLDLGINGNGSDSGTSSHFIVQAIKYEATAP